MVDFAALPLRPAAGVTRDELSYVKGQLKNKEIPPHLEILTQEHKKPSEITKEVMLLGARGVKEAHKISLIAARTLS